MVRRVPEYFIVFLFKKIISFFDNLNDEERQNMRFNDAFTRQNKRIDPDIKKKEKYLKYMNDDNNLKIYFKDINDTLVNICNSCEQILVQLNTIKCN